MRYTLQVTIEDTHEGMVAFTNALSLALPYLQPTTRVLTALVKIDDTPATNQPANGEPA